MKKFILVTYLLLTISSSSIAQRTFNSNGTWSESYTNPLGDTRTYNSNGSVSESHTDTLGNTRIYNSDGTWSETGR